MSQFIFWTTIFSNIEHFKSTETVIVQGVKDKIGLKASDVAQGLKICIHGQFHILN